MIFHGNPISLILPSIQLLLCLRPHWPHQGRFAFPLQLNDNSRDVLIAGERENYPAADKVEIRVEGVGVIQLDADRHRRRADGRLLIVFAWICSSSDGSEAVDFYVRPEVFGVVGCLCVAHDSASLKSLMPRVSTQAWLTWRDGDSRNRVDEMPHCELETEVIGGRSSRGLFSRRASLTE
jgi:hypothetical protein